MRADHPIFDIAKRIAPDILRALVSYNPDTGELADCNGKKCQRVGRYLKIKIDGKSYPAHLVAWAVMTGEWPADTLDHKNRDGLDNRWCNLREANQSQQNANRKIWAASGLRGVVKRGKKFRAEMRVDGKTTFLGLFATPEEAAAAVHARREQVWGEFARAAQEFRQ